MTGALVRRTRIRDCAGTDSLTGRQGMLRGVNWSDSELRAPRTER